MNRLEQAQMLLVLMAVPLKSCSVEAEEVEEVVEVVEVEEVEAEAEAEHLLSWLRLSALGQRQSSTRLSKCPPETFSTNHHWRETTAPEASLLASRY